MGVISDIIPGQILFAANLNTNYANCVSVMGDSIQGDLYLNNLTANSSLKVNNIDIGSGLQNAYNTANAAFSKANTGSPGGGSGNSAIASLTLTTSGTNPGLTVNNSTTITLTSNGTIILGANSATTSQVGVVQLNDTVTSTSTSEAGTANSVSTAMNEAVAAFARANTVDGISTITFQANTGSLIGLTVNDGVSSTLSGNGTIVIGANAATTMQIGVVQLNDTVTSTSAGYAATAGSVNTAYSHATAAFAKANTAISNVGNQILTGNVSIVGNLIANNLTVSGSVNSSSIIINSITGSTNYILSNRDNGATVVFSNSSQTLINVNSTLSIGFRCVLTMVGTGNVKIQSGVGVTLHPVSGINNQIAYQYGSATLFCYAPNTFILDGLLS